VAAGEGTFLAIAEKKVAAAGGTEVADENIFGVDTGVEKLSAVGFAQVEQNVFWRWLMAGRTHVEPLKRIGFIAGAEFIEPI